MKLGAEVSYKIPFHDTDALNIIWYGNHFKYFELARNEIFKKIKLDVPDWGKNSFFLLITEANCKYYSPLNIRKAAILFTRMFFL